MAYVKITDSDYKIYKENDYVLATYCFTDQGPDLHLYYDFVARVMAVAGNNSGQVAVPFSQLDPETLHFFRAELIKLGGTPPELPADIVNPAAPSEESWIDMGASSIAHVSVYPPLQKKITEIFNFESRQLQGSIENLRSHNEVFSSAVCFDALPEATVERAVVQFERSGHAVNRDFVLRGMRRIQK